MSVSLCWEPTNAGFGGTTSASVVRAGRVVIVRLIQRKVIPRVSSCK